jgi:hypothetical protein
LGTGVAGMSGAAIEAGVRRSRDVARVADDERPAVADGRLPPAT